MVISADGGTIYALSESGFLVLPIGKLKQSPLPMPESTAVLLANDICGVTSALRSVVVAITNAGSGRFTAHRAAGERDDGGRPPVRSRVRRRRRRGCAHSRARRRATATFTFNAVNARGPGTVTPTDFQIYSADAV